MKSLLLTFALTLSSVFAFGQTTPESNNENPATFNQNEVELPPVHPDCVDATTDSEKFECLNSTILSYTVQEFTATAEIRENGGGKAVGSFVIEKDGSITEIQIEKSAGYEAFDNEVLRVLRLIPNMEPAQVDGQPVRMKFSVPFSMRMM